MSVAIGVFFFELIRRPDKTKYMVWLSILGTIGGIFGLAYFFRLEYLQVKSINKLNNHTLDY